MASISEAGSKASSPPSGRAGSTPASSQPASSKASGAAPAGPVEKTASKVGSTSQLEATGNVSRNPEAATELAGVQGSFASKASGEPLASDARTENYLEVSDLLARAESGDPQAMSEASLRGVDQQTALMKDLAVGEFGEANGKVEIALGRVAEVNAMGAKVLAEQGTVLNPEEHKRLETYTQEEVAKVTPEVEEASAKMAAHLDDPLLRESFGDWSRQDKLDFFDGMSKNLALSEAGRGRLEDFSEGIAGKRDDPYAEAALELRETLSGEDKERLDRALGLAAGAGGSAGAPGILGASQAYQDAVEVGGSVTGLMTGVAPDAADWAGKALLTSRGARVVGNVAGPIGAVVDAVNLVDQLQKGDSVGAFGSVAGLTSAGLAAAGSSFAGPVGAVALGVDVYQALDESARYADFAQTGLDKAMGPDHPLREVVGQTSQRRLNQLDLDPSQPGRPQLEAKAEEYWGPDWQNYATEYRDPAAELFWAELEHSQSMSALALNSL